MSEQEPSIKVKKERTPAQLEHLRLAREKALQVRKANAELKKKEREVDRAELEQKKKARVDAVETAYKQLKGEEPKAEENDAGDEEEEVEYVYEKKPKKKKKRVVVVQQSDSEDEEVEVVLPKRREVPKVDERRDAMYKKMFGL